jgi:hypothetical protein
MEFTVESPIPLTGQSSEDLARRARPLLVIDEVRAGRLTRGAAARPLDMGLDDPTANPTSTQAAGPLRGKPPEMDSRRQRFSNPHEA